MISTHVLDTALGRPAAGVPVRLERLDAATVLAAVTDADGRAGGFPVERPGGYRLVFDTAAYFASTGRTGFFPEITVVFTVTDPAERVHVPLLLSPFGYSAYRGS